MGIYIIALYWYKIIVLIKEGYKRIFINPTGAEKQKILYKKSGVFTLQLLFYFYSFLTIILLFIFYIVRCKHVIDHLLFYS